MPGGFGGYRGGGMAKPRGGGFYGGRVGGMGGARGLSGGAYRGLSQGSFATRHFAPGGAGGIGRGAAGLGGVRSGLAGPGAGNFLARHSLAGTSVAGRGNVALARHSSAGNINNFSYNRVYNGGISGGRHGLGGYGLGRYGYGGYGLGRYGYGFGRYGFGFPFLGYGLGGLGYGLGYGGYGLGYGGYGLGYGGYGLGYGGYGLGYGGYGLGYGGYGLGYGGYGYPYYGNYGYGSYGYPYYYGAYTSASQPAAVAQGQSATPQPAARNFAELGEQDFKAARYTDAIRDWQHALVDDPQNGGVMMLMAQALFASGRFDEAAGATQQAMQLLPQDKWGTVVANYSELYRSPADYTSQLRALEAARKEHDSPAVRFLLGFHYGYLGYPKDAVRELDRVVEMNPHDQAAKDLRDLFSDKPPVTNPAAIVPRRST
jgi:hypothetical protein